MRLDWQVLDETELDCQKYWIAKYWIGDKYWMRHYWIGGKYWIGNYWIAKYSVLDFTIELQIEFNH